MADRRVARRYANALFTTALKYDVVKGVEDDLNSIVGLLDNDPEFREFVIAPYTGRDQKIEIVERMFSDRVTALTMQVLRVMLEKRREDEIIGVRDEFVTLRREHAGVIFAVVTSAREIEAAQRKALLAKLEQTIGKKIEAEFKLDPHLIGGIRVAYGNYVLDGSVRGTLSSLRDRLRHDLLKQQ
jgi:F-type H+-transporting ATPase subunit delta